MSYFVAIGSIAAPSIALEASQTYAKLLDKAVAHSVPIRAVSGAESALKCLLRGVDTESRTEGMP